MLISGLALWTLAAWGLDRYGRRRLPSDARFDAIVVLGCRVMDDGTPSGALAQRVRLAASLYRQGRAPRIICTGGIGESPYAESKVAKDMAVSLGVPREAILTEHQSTTTLENARHAARVGSEAPIRRVLVVTDAYHVLRARRVFGRFFEHASGLGCVHPSWRVRGRGALREVWVVLGYALLGRL